MRVSATTNADVLGRKLSDVVARQVPFALSNALTSEAKLIREAEVTEMRRAFDRPTPYTLNAFKVIPSRKETLVAEVQHKDTRSYLPVEARGGVRPAVGFESALRAASPAPFAAAIPARAASRDAYGNWSASERSRVLTALQAQGPLRSTGMMGSSRRTEFYFGQRGNVFGVWRRQGDDDDLILLLTQNAADYQLRFDFHGVARRTFAATFDAEFGRAMEKALSTAR